RRHRHPGDVRLRPRDRLRQRLARHPDRAAVLHLHPRDPAHTAPPEQRPTPPPPPAPRGPTTALTRQITNLTIVNLPDAAKSDPAFIPFATTLFKIDTGTFKVELVWWIVVVVLASWVLMRTRFGNWIYAVGGSAQAARYVGVPVNRVKILLFMGTAASAALYACVVVPSVGSANVRDGTNREFEAIITA